MTLPKDVSSSGESLFLVSVSRLLSIADVRVRLRTSFFFKFLDLTAAFLFVCLLR